MSFRKHATGGDSAIYERVFFFFFSSDGLTASGPKVVGSGCCINAATVLAVIDSCRKATAAAASTTRRARAHAISRIDAKIGANTSEGARENFEWTIEHRIL